jgi:FKBP-type peptidyl-prolyl cis-trans isomerase SlyD
MSESKLAVSDGMAVGIHYTLTLTGGEVVDSSEGDDALWFLQGAGQIIPGLERELYGMSLGDKKQVTVLPEDGYGDYDPDDTQLLSHDLFPADEPIEVGQDVQLRDADSGQVFQAFVVEVGDDGVLVDFNHPLAGQELLFDVNIAGLRRATSGELSHGHVHGPAGHDH